VALANAPVLHSREAVQNGSDVASRIRKREAFRESRTRLFYNVLASRGT